MSYKRLGNQVCTSDAGSGTVALISCLLLLTGCAGTSNVGLRSGEIAPPGAPTMGTPETVGAAARRETAAMGREPRIMFEMNVHDFGEIGLLTQHVCEFRFKNTGMGVLKVEGKIDAVCGCVVPVLSQTVYAPGAAGTIQVTYMAGDSLGPTTKLLKVHSNDKTDGGIVGLQIQATVVERVAYEPRQLELRFKGPQANCPPITLRSLDHRSFAVTGILSNGSALAADVDASRQAPEFTLQPTLDPEQLQKHPTGNLVLTLTHPECPEVRIPYQIVPEFQFTPSSVVVFNAEPNHPVLLDGVVLSNSYAEEFDVASYASKAHRVRVMGKEKVVADDQQSMGYRLRLGILPPAVSNPQGFFEDVLRVRLTNGKELQLPCRLFYHQPQE
ncbi:MAG: DUF1573 domain-containing protein [Planctomycetes bacterium]|nr:DUF1573 domain-containing protein [Planctomycetota bacterium]